jgi:hypothetical protein
MALLPLAVRLGVPLLAALFAIAVAGPSRLSTVPALPPMGKRPVTITPARFGPNKPPGAVCRALKTKHLKQIKAVLFVLVSAPVILTDLPPPALCPWPPAQKNRACAFFHIT